MKERIACVIPCFNSEKQISRVVEDCLDYVSEVYVIDDGSIDNSAKTALKSGARVYSSKMNEGVGRATCIGFELALVDGYKTIITVDSDGAHDPADIKKILRTHFASKNILTIGNRWDSYKPEIPSQKWWANKFASMLVNKTTMMNLRDVACGFRVYDSKLAMECINQSYSNDYGFLYEIIFTARKIGKIGNASVDVRYDANEFLATKQKELLSLIDIIAEHCKDSSFSEKICKIKEGVLDFQKIFVILKQRKNDYLILQPLKEYKQYFFQWQNPYFIYLNGKEIEI